MENFHPRYRSLSQPLSLACTANHLSLTSTRLALCFFFFVDGMYPIFLFFVSLCSVQKAKRALQHVVFAPPWRSGQDVSFENPHEVSSIPTILFVVFEKGMFALLKTLLIRHLPMVIHISLVLQYIYSLLLTLGSSERKHSRWSIR